MALSTEYTSIDFFRQAVSEISQFKQNSKIFTQRFDLINGTQEAVQGQFADLVAEAYMTDATPVLNEVGKYYTSGASYVAATKRLTATMAETGWAVTDVGNMIMFRDGANIYVAEISQRISTTVVVISGDNLPAADIAAVSDVLMAATGVDGSSPIDISSLRMLRYSNQLGLRLESTATKYVIPLDPVAFQKFQPSAWSNKDKIGWMLQGNKLLVKLGSSLASGGTLKLWYPRLPYVITTDSEYVDLLDGAMVQIGILVLKTRIQKRLNLPVQPETVQEMQDKIGLLYNSFSGNIKKEEIQSKVEALV